MDKSIYQANVDGTKLVKANSGTFQRFQTGQAKSTIIFVLLILLNEQGDKNKFLLTTFYS